MVVRKLSKTTSVMSVKVYLHRSMKQRERKFSPSWRTGSECRIFVRFNPKYLQSCTCWGWEEWPCWITCVAASVLLALVSLWRHMSTLTSWLAEELQYVSLKSCYAAANQAPKGCHEDLSTEGTQSGQEHDIQTENQVGRFGHFFLPWIYSFIQAWIIEWDLCCEE